MRRLSSLLALVALLPLGACTGLVAGSQVQATSTVPVTSDSAWARARRGFTAEVMTVERADSISGVLNARRYPKTSADANAIERCHVLLHLDLTPSGDGTALKWESQWVAPRMMAEKQSAACDAERDEVRGRIEQTISPTPVS
jgi:hypothetical protein